MQMGAQGQHRLSVNGDLFDVSSHSLMNGVFSN